MADLGLPCCWERLRVGGEGDDRGWDGWMASPTQWTWVWVSSGSWWWTGRPGMLQSMGSQRIGHDWATELNWTGSSADKESACSAEDPGLIPGSGRSPGEWIGYPLQYSWASLVTQTVKNPPAVRDTWVWSLGREALLEEGIATTPVFLPGEPQWTEELSGLQSMGSQRVGHNWATKHSIAHDWFVLLCSRNQHNFVKQFSST